MPTVLITDDEFPARALIREFLGAFPECTVVAECHNGRECLEAVQHYEPDIVFLDIQMPGMTGFDAVHQLRQLSLTNIPFIIFSTAFDQYALQAFEVNAAEYLLKPYTQERFQTAVQRVLERLAARVSTRVSEHSRSVNTETPEYMRHLANVVESFAAAQKQAESPLQTLMVRHGNKIVALQAEFIEWIEAADDYTLLHSGDAEYLASTTMSTLEQRLDTRFFKRVHRSTIINIRYLRHLEPDASGGMTATMLSGNKVKVSRSFAGELRKMIV